MRPSVWNFSFLFIDSKDYPQLKHIRNKISTVVKYHSSNLRHNLRSRKWNQWQLVFVSMSNCAIIVWNIFFERWSNFGFLVSSVSISNVSIEDS